MEEWIVFAREAQEFPWVRTLEVLVFSAFAAKIVSLLISRILLRLTQWTDTDLDDQLVELIHRPVFVSVILIGFYVAIKILGWNPGLEHVLIALIQTAAIFVWTSAGFKFTSTTLTGLSRLANRVTWLEARTLPLFDNLSKIVVFGAATYCLLVTWELDLSAWLASAGIVGIAVGFGAKDTVANFFAGIFILADAPYRIGDFIILDTGERGRVTHIGLRSTRLLTRDDIEVTVPNAVMGNTKIINETGGPHKKERIRVKIACAYGSDIDHVKKVLVECALHVDGVCTDPEPRVRFRAFGPSGLELELLGWIDEPVLRGRVTDALNTEVYRRFNQEKIEIPYMKQDVYIKEMPR